MEHTITALTAQKRNQQRVNVYLDGDFAFGLSVMELETAVRHHIPIVIVVANNDGNGGSLRHRMHMKDTGAETVTMYQKGLRYDAIAGVLGCYSEYIEKATDIGPALARAIASRRPACINVTVDRDAPFPSD